MKADAPAAKAEAPAAKADAPAGKPAPRPAKAPPPPDPRAVAAKDKADKIKADIEGALGSGVVADTGAAKDVPLLRIEPKYWAKAFEYLKSAPEYACDYIELFSGTDLIDKGVIEVTVYIQSMQRGHYLNIKTHTPRDDARLPSLVPIFAGVNWEEREVYDLLGVTFDGHPDLRRIMMWDGWNGWPLRKDYNDFDNIPTRGGDPV
ncbi:MAG: NADH-quinone oxidoreductase subunit C [Firmicutes bacterium]|nr:NADH-quinone oxidoreductase subunit C [Bacillota bacterium]